MAAFYLARAVSVSVTSARATIVFIAHLLSRFYHTPVSGARQSKKHAANTSPFFCLHADAFLAIFHVWSVGRGSRKLDAIERLKAERTELIARLSKIEAVIAQHAELQRSVEELLAGAPKIVASVGSATAKSSASAESAGRRVTADVADFERAIREILSVAQEPLDRNELYKICVDRNIPVGGKEPLNTLASRMSRMDGVENIRGKGYFLKDRLHELQPRRMPGIAITPSEALQSIAATRSDVPDSETRRSKFDWESDAQS